MTIRIPERQAVMDQSPSPPPLAEAMVEDAFQLVRFGAGRRHTVRPLRAPMSAAIEASFVVSQKQTFGSDGMTSWFDPGHPATVSSQAKWDTAVDSSGYLS